MIKPLLFQPWAQGLLDICNGRKTRFLSYLQLFITETGNEVHQWEHWMETNENVLLALSLHKILPHIKIFSGDDLWNRAAGIEKQVNIRLDEPCREELNGLRHQLLISSKEATLLAGEIKRAL